jgi:adenylate kinase family enzyme
MKPITIILLGDPASGKGVQAMRIVKRYRLHDFDMGKELRKPVWRTKSNYEGTAAHGNLSPTGVVREILHKVIHGVPRTKGILFNGHPKMIGEAKLVARLLKREERSDPIVIYLSIPLREVVRRASIRKREDDDASGLANRRRYYKVQVAKVVAFFKKQYAFKTVSGLGTPAQVETRITKVIQWNLKHHRK